MRRAQFGQIQAHITELEAGKKRLTEDLNRAQQRLEGAYSAGKRQATAFSRDVNKPDPSDQGP